MKDEKTFTHVHGTKPVEPSDLKFGLLADPKEVLAVQRLTKKFVYDIMGFEVEKDAKAGLRLVKHPEGDYLDDDYGPLAEWVGVKKGKDILGAIRVISPLNGLLEVEETHIIPDSIRASTVREMNRAIANWEYDPIPIYATLFAGAYDYCLERGFDYLVVNLGIAGMNTFFERMGFTHLLKKDGTVHTIGTPAEVTAMYSCLKDRPPGYKLSARLRKA